jgi:iron complex outermembrane receptor protein
VAGSWTHLLSFKQPLVAGQAPYEGAGNNRHGALPRTRGTTSLNWAVGDWSSTLSLQYVSGYDQRVATATSNPACATASSRITSWTCTWRTKAFPTPRCRCRC